MYFSIYLNSLKQETQSFFLTYKIPLIIAFIQFTLIMLFKFDKLFFDYSHYNLKILPIKLVLLSFLAISWCFVFNVKRQLKAKNSFYQRAFKIFCVYYSICLILMVLIWPGTWFWDDICTLENIKNYRSLFAWQHILTGLYLDILLNIIPTPGGAIVLQLGIISIIVSYVITKLEFSFNLPKFTHSYLDIIVKCIPFMLPPIILFQYSGYRIGIYMFLELCSIVMLVCSKRENTDWSKTKFYTFVALCILVSTWRSEAALYLPLICILIFFVNKKVLSKVRKLKFIAIFFLGFSIVSFAQKILLGNDNYLIISICNISTELVHHMDRNKFKNELAIFDKFIPIAIIDKNPSMTGTDHFWNENVKTNTTRQDLKEYIMAIIKLSFEYPTVVLHERNRYFWEAMYGRQLWSIDTTSVFDTNTKFNTGILYKNSKWIFKLPISTNLRKKFLETIFLKNQLNSIPAKIMWNNFIPTVFLLIFTTALLVRKQWFYSAVLLIVLSKISIIYMTSPASLFMYFVSYYFLGYSVFMFSVFIICSKLRNYSKN